MAFDCHFVPYIFVLEQIKKLIFLDADFVQDNYPFFKEIVGMDEIVPFKETVE